MSKRSQEVMKKLVGIQCRQCQKYFRTSKHLIEHERKYHFNQTFGTSFASGLGTASSFPGYSSTGNISQNFSNNSPFSPSPVSTDSDDDDGFGGFGGGGLGGGGFGGFGGGNSAGGGASGGW